MSEEKTSEVKGEEPWLAMELVSGGTLADLTTHPALVRAEVQTPAGPASIVAPPVLIDGRVRALGPVPGIGEHSARIRTEFASAR